MRKVSLIIIIFNDKYLLFKRSKLNHEFKNLYGLIGGGIEEGETPKEAAIREAQEEINIDLPNIKHLKNYKFDNSFLNVFYAKINNIDDIKLNSEHTEFDMFTLDELSNNPDVIPTTPKIINDYLDKSNIIKELYGSTDGNDDILSDDGDVFNAVKDNGTSITMNEPIMDESGTDRYTSDYGVGDTKYGVYNVEHDNDNKDNFSNDELLERRTAWINGSKGVNVKEKCRLGGGTICNQGDINNLEFSKLSLTEEIDASEAYKDIDAIKTIIQGRKGAGIVSLTPQIKELIIQNNLNIIKVIPQRHNRYIVYKDQKDKALALYDYLKEHDGYLNDQTPEQAWKIGNLLDYSDESIKKYIKRVYIDKIDAFGKKYPEDRFPEDMVVDPRFIDEDVNEGVNNTSEIFQNLKEILEARKFKRFDQQIYNSVIRKLSKTTIGRNPFAIAMEIFDKLPKISWDEYQQNGVGLNEIEEGVGDKYFEKKTGAKPEFDDFENKYNEKKIKDNQENIVYNDENLTIIANPKSLNNIGLNVRGIIDKNGTLYIERESHTTHDDMIEKLSNLGIIKFIDAWNLLLPTDFITVIRYGDTNRFYLGESNKMMIPDEDRTENVEKYRNKWYTIPPYMQSYRIFQKFLDKAKQKNPSIDFINEMVRYTFGINEENKEKMNEAELISLNDLPFKYDIEQLGGKIFSVGGAVRDSFLGKESKDLDILITGVPMDKLEQILGNYGRVDAVGKSFGIIKFKANGSDPNEEPIDIAIPRTERATGDGGHKDFQITSDHELPIEKDLERRDFTINAIAKDNNGNLIDPYGGQEDLKNKVIRAVNPAAFSDDPLRMLRAVQFASRFGFTIEPNTMNMIVNSAEMIKKEPSERLLTEFDKIIKKGNIRVGVQLLKDTKLFENIFGFELKQSTINRSPFEEVQTMGEFIFLMIRLLPNPSEFYLKKFGTEDAKRNKNYKDIKALDLAFNYSGNNSIEARSVAHNMYIISQPSLESKILPEVIQNACNELLSGKYPKTVNELALNGGDLMNLGLKGREIGDMQKKILINVYADKVANTTEDLTAFLNKSNIRENINETVSGGEYIMYHGTDHDITNFTDEFVGGKEANDQEGPGIYFTNSIEEAATYGKNIYKVIIKPRKLTDIANKSVVSTANITKLIRMSPSIDVNNEDSLSNWDINPNVAVRKAVASLIEYAENEKDLFQQIWIDFYRNYPRDFVKNMVKLGFDGQLIKNKNIHIILYNPITITSVEKLNDNQINDMEKTPISEEYIMKDISYSAVVLNERSKNKLIETFKNKIPEGYRIVADHMTICLGALPENQKKDIGLTVQLAVESFAMDDKVIAVGVTGYPSKNEHPHITLAVNDQNGGKAMMSNYLTNWEKALRIRVSGVITEVPYKIY